MHWPYLDAMVLYNQAKEPAVSVPHANFHHANLPLTRKSLAGVNFGLGCVGVIQCTRIFLYNSRVKGETPKEQLVEAKADVVHVAEGLKDEVKAAISK